MQVPINSLTIIMAVLAASVSGERYKIVGLFNENNYDAMFAFTSAVKWKNLYSTVVSVDYEILTVSETDTFQTTKKICALVEKEGVIGFFGPQSPITSAMAQSICSKLEIPYIEIYLKPMITFSPKMVLNMYPEVELLAKGISMIVKELKWVSFTILYEDSDALIKLKDVLEIPTATPITLRQLSSDMDHRLVLKEIKNSTVAHIILDCEADRIVSILEQAKAVGLLTNMHNYFLTSLDAHTVDLSPLETNTNITTLRIVDPENEATKRLVRNWHARFDHAGRANEDVTWRAIRSESALMSDAVTHFIERFTELIKTQTIIPRPISCSGADKWSSGYLLSEYLKIRPLQNATTGPIQFDKNGDRIKFNLQVVQYIQDKQNVTAFWSTDTPWAINFTASSEEREQQLLQSLSKTTIIVASKLGPPYLIEKKRKQDEILTGNDRYEGYSMDLIRAIANHINFTFVFELTRDNANGAYNKDTKKWNGLIGDLLENRAHLAICDLTITHERREVVDFSIPFMSLGIGILHKKPTSEERNIFAFMDPLSLDVWLYTATAYLAVSVMLYFIARMAPGDWENPHPCDENPEELENIWDLKNCMWLTLGSIMTQGCDILPKGISSRMATSMWWFFSLIMTSSYTANLAAFLTMERMDAGVDSVEALAKQTKIKYGLMEGGATETFFKETNFSTYQRMWTQMQSFEPRVFEKDNDSGVKRVISTKNQGYAFFMESSTIDYVTAKNCDLRRVGLPLDSKGYGIAMPMNAPYRSLINRAILKLQEDGTLNRLKTTWWKDKVEEKCDEEKSDGGSSSELALANVGGVFVVLGVGVAIAFIIAIAEFLWNIRSVSVEEHITYLEAFKIELKFACNIWITKKAAKAKVSGSSPSPSIKGAEENLMRDVLHGASSILRLDTIFDRISMHNKG